MLDSAVHALDTTQMIRGLEIDAAHWLARAADRDPTGLAEIAPLRRAPVVEHAEALGELDRVYAAGWARNDPC